MMRWAPTAFLAAVVVADMGAVQGLKTPGDWKWIPDGPATVIETGEAGPAAMVFVAMPPGWHVTQGPGALLYQPDYQGRGNFAVEAEIFLFPGESPEEYGVFFGGRSLEPAPASRAYLAFVGRRDGKGAVLERTAAGITPLANWMSNDAILPQAGADAQKNVLRVDVGATEVTFSANGKPVTKLPRQGLAVDGQFGLRIGKGVNVHVSRLDVTHRLAPVRK